jgi:hypothetical protein
VRLTKVIKERAIEEVINESVSAKAAALNKEYAEIAQKAANSLYPPKTRKWIEAAPKGALTTLGSFRFKGVPEVGRLASSASLKKPIRLTAEHLYQHSFPVPEKYSKRVKEIVDEFGEIEKQAKEIKATLSAALAGVTTRKSAVKSYPGLEKFLPVDAMEGKHLAVAPEVVSKILSAIPKSKAA